MKSNNTYLLWPALILMHLAFFIYGLCCGTILLKDSTEYLAQANNILNNGTWYSGDMHAPIIPQLFSQRPPLYGFFILLLHFLSNTGVIISFVQSLLSLLNIFIAFKIIKTLNPKPLNPKVFFLPFLFFPSQFIYANLIMPEMLFQTALMLSAYFLLSYFQEKKQSTLLYYQFSITTALLIKPVFFIFPILSLLLFFILEKKIIDKIKALAFHIIPAAAIVLVSWINYSHTDYFEYSSIQRKLMINYSARYSAAHNIGDEKALQQIDSIESTAAALPSYPEKARHIQSGAASIIQQNSGAFILLTFKGIINFFIDHSRYDIDSFRGNEPKETQVGWKENYQKDGVKGIIDYLSSVNLIYYFYLLVCILVNVFLLAGLFRFAINKQIPFYYRLIILSIIFYVALLTGMTGSSRFRLPVFLLIIIANMIVIGYKNKFLVQEKQKV